MVIFLFCYQIKAQDKIEEASFNYQGRTNPSLFIGLNYHVKESVLRKYCYKSVAYFKFRINEKAKIDTIVILNYDAPKELVEGYKNAIEATNGYWSPRKINGVAVKSKFFILPVAYSFAHSCDDKSPIEDNTWNALQKMTDGDIYDGIVLGLIQTAVRRPDSQIKANK